MLSNFDRVACIVATVEAGYYIIITSQHVSELAFACLAGSGVEAGASEPPSQ